MAEPFARTILTWYAAHGRALPWRGVSDPYLIWVSEVILQQTRVAQGYEYYRRFVSAFPTVEHLAAATEDEVMRLWQGLGYYSRARNMHAAARQIVAQGGFPQNYEGLIRLRGVGTYTAASVSSFAFGERRAVVDGNVYRVLSRYFGIDVPIDSTAGKKYFAAFAEKLLPERDAASYNQALMDFGALQCIPAAPRCQGCPLSSGCLAYAGGRVGALPVKARHTSQTERYLTYLRVETPEGVWLRRRTRNDIWKGLYEYYLVESDRQTSFHELLQTDEVSRLPAGGEWHVVKKRLKHVLTHRILWINLYTLTYEQPVATPPYYICVPKDELAHYARPKALLGF